MSPKSTLRLDLCIYAEDRHQQEAQLCICIQVLKAIYLAGTENVGSGSVRIPHWLTEVLRSCLTSNSRVADRRWCSFVGCEFDCRPGDGCAHAKRASEVDRSRHCLSDWRSDHPWRDCDPTKGSASLDENE